MSEVASLGTDEMIASRSRVRAFRRRRRPDVRALLTGVAVFVAIAWTIIFGAGVVLR